MVYAGSQIAKSDQQVHQQAAINLFPTCRMNPATGYGKMELGLVKGLTEMGVSVAIVDQFSEPRHEITLITSSPEWGEYVPGRKWAYTMSESTKVSQIWVDALNSLFERVIVPAPFLVDVYGKSGVNIPIHYIPLGVDYHAPAYVERDPQPERFNWLTYSLGDTRKGAELAAMSFNRLFGGDERHHLYIKCRDNPQYLSGLEDPQMTLVRGETSEGGWLNLLAKCHAFIFPSRAEGFGLPPREATFTGLPTIATEAHGLWDVAKWGYPIPVQEMRPSQFDFCDANAEGSLWWDPERLAIDAQMKTIFENYPAALARAKAGGDYLRRNFTWKNTARAIMRLLR